ncbi:MAG: hypothetical protein RL329_1907 [Bacteroidota bacterium]
MKVNHFIPICFLLNAMISCDTTKKTVDLAKNPLQKPIVASKDTFDPEQRVPFGAVRRYAGRIPATGAAAITPRIDPPNWWIGMKEPSVELTIHDTDIHQSEVIINYPGVKINKIYRPENPNYLFLDLNLAAAKVGEMTILLKKTNGNLKKYPYMLMPRKGTTGNRIRGINTSDFVYLIMPDRFSYGDTTNNSFNDMEQRGIDRKKMYFRHGGDLQGVINHLDYLKELGVTAIWLNPINENDEPYESYHGYAFTDHYRTDKRLGGNAKFMELVDKARAKDIKIVMDLVHNHCGDRHYFIKDLPEKDWIHQYDTMTRTNYRDQTIFDPYASKADQNLMLNGWFDNHMPDLNQKNPHLANYLIQNNLWWVELSGLDGYRLDTYLYNDPDFMAEWGRRMQAEYPTLGIFAETWVTGTANQAQTTQNNFLRKPYNSNLPGVTDFQNYYAITEALTRQQGWQEGIMRMYQTLSNDFLYENAYRNVNFLGNHDLARIYSVVGEDVDKFKSGVAWLMTCRGIPQFYYGDELLFKGFTNPDGKVRQDMSGGFQGDTTTVFTEKGRTALQNESFNYVKKLANWRKTNTAVQNGKLMQFIPEKGVYVYFRYDTASTVMIVMNTSDKKVVIHADKESRFAERTELFTQGKNVVNEQVIDLKNIELNKNSAVILELK